ncbi:MAG: OadG family transporter subunit [Bacillota bacterium]|nr:OadG family transporter subunit [Bacillota bacterium]
MIGNEVTGMEALTVTVFSMGLVFLTLYAISLILDAFKVQSERDQRVQAKKEEAKKAKEKPEKQEPPVVEQKEDDGELIAIITAALAASLNTSKDKLIIKNIRQIQDPTWAQTGRIQNMN